MIHTISAFTYELDDLAIAVAEIQGQIDTGKLCAHSLGILTCSTDFVDNGIVRAVSEALPFNVIGCTTAGSMVNGEVGELMLSLLVLTSDDVVFSAALTGSLAEAQDSPIEAAYRKAAEGKSGKPAVALAFAPVIYNVCGEAIVQSFSRVSGGIPLFGTLAIDTTQDFSHCETLYNGMNSKTAMSFALIYGDIHPSFFMASIPEDKIQKQRGVITKSKDNILMEINNMPLLDYLETLGLYRKTDSWEIASFPFVVDYNDGTKPVTRIIYMITDDGYASCGGFMPKNATISLGWLDTNDILRTTSETVSRILETNDNPCIIMFSCLGRYLRMGVYTTAEMEKVRETITGEKNYQFCYSGGEICPVYTDDGTLINRFHNCSFIACVL
jgi:hypothetical protein